VHTIYTPELYILYIHYMIIDDLPIGGKGSAGANLDSACCNATVGYSGSCPVIAGIVPSIKYCILGHDMFINSRLPCNIIR
jgi:hypothetical protein